MIRASGGPGPSTGSLTATRACGSALVAIRHHPMRRLTRRVLEDGCPACVVDELGEGELLVEAIERVHPTVLIVDAEDFPACCREALAAFPPERVMVVGPEPESAYRVAALSIGAGAWVARDSIADDAAAAVQAMLAAAGRRPSAQDGT